MTTTHKAAAPEANLDAESGRQKFRSKFKKADSPEKVQKSKPAPPTPSRCYPYFWWRGFAACWFAGGGLAVLLGVAVLVLVSSASTA